MKTSRRTRPASSADAVTPLKTATARPAGAVATADAYVMFVNVRVELKVDLNVA